MPHFSAKGNDTYICQVCARIYDSVDHPPTWLPIERRADKSNGAVCPACVRRGQTPTQPAAPPAPVDPGPMGLYEHCYRESGGLTGAALDNYINRYYGHG